MQGFIVLLCFVRFLELSLLEFSDVLQFRMITLKVWYAAASSLNSREAVNPIGVACH